MEAPDSCVLNQLRSLERRLRTTQIVAAAAFACLVGLSAGGARQDSEVVDLIRARRIEVVDDQGVMRISIGQDAADTHRRSRACGIALHDAKGDERGGLGTMDDLSAVIALDAPVGVGGPMRDRVGMMVSPDGSAQIVVIDNQMQAAARLASGPKGGGWLEVYGYDAESKQGTLRRVTHAGDEASQLPLEEEK